MQNHIEQAALAREIDRGHAVERIANPATGGHMPQCAAEFGDKSASVGQKRQAPGQVQFIRPGLQAVFGGPQERAWAGDQKNQENNRKSRHVCIAFLC